MSLKDSLQRKLETQTEHWSKQIESLRAEANEKIAKAKDEEAEAKIQRTSQNASRPWKTRLKRPEPSWAS